MGIYSLSFVWKIEIKGNDKVSTQEIIDCLQENHVEIGLKKQSVDCSGIELILREQFSQLGWVSVYFEYTNLCVEVKESLYDVVEHPETEYGKMYHLVANKPARINSIVTRTGKAVVTKGQLVKPGDILVLGQNEIIDDSGEIREIIYLKADALIYGDVEYDLLIPISEMEIAALKLAGDYREEDLLQLAYYKMSSFINKLEDNNVIILDTEIHLEKKEKNICFWAKIYAREQIGINIPVEEVAEYEFE